MKSKIKPYHGGLKVVCKLFLRSGIFTGLASADSYSALILKPTPNGQPT